VLRGEWRSGGIPLGPADGLIWQGYPETILGALAGYGRDEAAFHPGLPGVAPSLRMEGLGAWRQREHEEGPAAELESRWPVRPPAPRE